MTPSFNFYPERFWFAVEGWSDREIVAYMRLLSQQWLSGGLPDNMKELTGKARGKITDRVLAKFPVAEDGTRRNAFMEKVRAEQDARIQKAKDRAAKMNDARWHPKKEPPPKEPPDDQQGLHKDSGAEDSHPVPVPISPNGDKPSSTGHKATIPTLAQARDFAPSIGVTPDEAEQWWHAREASEWTRSSNGVASKIGSVKSDCKTYVLALRQRKSSQQSHANRNSHPQRNDSANTPGRYASTASAS